MSLNHALSYSKASTLGPGNLNGRLENFSIFDLNVTDVATIATENVATANITNATITTENVITSNITTANIANATITTETVTNLVAAGETITGNLVVNGKAIVGANAVYGNTVLGVGSAATAGQNGAIVACTSNSTVNPIVNNALFLQNLDNTNNNFTTLGFLNSADVYGGYISCLNAVNAAPATGQLAFYTTTVGLPAQALVLAAGNATFPGTVTVVGNGSFGGTGSFGGNVAINGATLTLATGSVVATQGVGRFDNIIINPDSKTPGTVYSNTYVPTITPVAGLSAATVGPHFYQQIGKVCTVTGSFIGTTTGASTSVTEFTITLPPPTPNNFTTTNQAVGTGNCFVAAGSSNSSNLIFQSTNGATTLTGFSSVLTPTVASGTNLTYTYSVTYLVIF